MEATVATTHTTPVWMWTPHPGDVTKPTPAGVVVIRGTTLLLVDPTTGVEALLATVDAPVDAIATARVGDLDTIVWVTGGSVAWASTTMPDQHGAAALPADASVYTMGDGVAATDTATTWILTPDGFAPVDTPTGATILGTDHTGVWSTTTGTDLIASRPGRPPAPMALTPPTPGQVLLRVSAASWGHSLTVWQTPGQPDTVAALHDLATGLPTSAWADDTDWGDPRFGPSRMSVTSGTTTAWLAPPAPGCDLAGRGVVTGALGSLLTVSTPTGPALLTPSCVLAPTTTPPAAATPDGHWVLTPGVSGAWTGVKVEE